MVPSSPWCHWLLVPDQQHLEDGTESNFSAKNHLFSGGKGTGTSCHLVCGNGLWVCVCVRGLDRVSGLWIWDEKADLLVKRWLHRVLMHWGKVSCKLDSITVIDKGSWCTSQLGFLNTEFKTVVLYKHISTIKMVHYHLCVQMKYSSAQGHRWMGIYPRWQIRTWKSIDIYLSTLCVSCSVKSRHYPITIMCRNIFFKYITLLCACNLLSQSACNILNKYTYNNTNLHTNDL